MATPAVDLLNLERVNVGRVLHDAAIFDFSRHRSHESFVNAANIPAEVEAFFELLEQRAVDFLLVGGLAMLAHVHGRNTDDIDLVISTPDQQRLEPEVKVIEREPFFAQAQFRGLRIDFLAAENPLFDFVARNYSEAREFDFFARPRSIRCAAPRGLMLLKLYALPSLYRQGEISRARIFEADIGALLGAVPETDTEELLEILSRHGVSETDVRELRNVIAEQRPRRRFS
jgi:hypothetical protein